MEKKTESEPKQTVQVDEDGRKRADKILFDALGPNYSLDWSLPQSVGQKGDERFVGDSLVIVSDTRDAFDILYGGYRFSGHGSGTPLGELSSRLTNEIPGIGRVFVEIARRSE